MAEWSNAPDSKSGVRVLPDRGFESLPFRQTIDINGPSGPIGHFGRKSAAATLHNAGVMRMHRLSCCLLSASVVLAGCATRSQDVAPAAADHAEFTGWTCARVQDELDSVQQRASDMAYAVDERAGNNLVALGVGVAIFWPALLAMRPAGLEAEELARLKGRYEALRNAERQRACAPAPSGLAPEKAALLPVAVGDWLVYEERALPRGALVERRLRVAALRRDEIGYASAAGAAEGWRQDLAGNLWSSPQGQLLWHRLLKPDLVLGQVLDGEFQLEGDPLTRARVRGQVVAVGQQTVAGRSFDAAVVELFGDALRADGSARLDGVIVVDRRSGVLLRLDLNSSMAPFSLQRRLARVERSP